MPNGRLTQRSGRPVHGQRLPGDHGPAGAGLAEFRGAMLLVAAGLAIGLAASLAASRLLVSLLYGVSPLDLPAWAGTTVTLFAAGLAAAIFPAWRATRADPIAALRAE